MDIKKLLPHIIALVVILVASLANFYPQLEGKLVPQGDIISYKGMSNEMKQFRDKTGDEMLWTNAMFGGMPTYQISSRQPYNLIRYTGNVMYLFIKSPIGKFFFLMLCMYLLMTAIGVRYGLALVAALAFGLTTNNFVLYEAGHNTKLDAIASGALIAAGLILLFRKKYLLGGSIFTFGLALNILKNHPQMTYYWAIILGIYFLIEAIRLIRQQDMSSLLKIAGICAIGSALALGSNATKLWTTLEYAEDTMRGEPILQSEGTPTSSSETDGLEWSYAMNWSNGWLDVVANYIPAVVGGSSAEPIRDGFEMSRIARQNGFDKFSYYWGPLPFTSGPAYYGAIMIFLFIFSFFYLPKSIRLWALLSFLAITFMSMGKNLATFNRLLFDYLPMLNKFRSPNSAMSVLALFVPFIGIWGLDRFLRKSEYDQSDLRNLYISAGSLIGFSLILYLMGSSLFDFTSDGDQRYAQMGLDVNMLVQDRISLMKSDALRSLLFVLLAGAAVWAYVKNYFKMNILIVLMAILAVFDVLPVSQRYLSPDDFVSARKEKQNYTPRPVDEQILKMEPKGRGYYRVFDQSINTFNSSSTSYFHNTIGGYNAAKLQRIQDVIDRHISKNNMDVLNMLNAKYFINQQGKLSVNSEALGNAWLVDQVRFVSTPNQEIDALGDFSPSETAIVHEEFKNGVKTSIASQGDISLESYRPDRLTYKANVSGNGALAVFSEIWYGPSKGWKAYVDGEEAELIRANYLLRAINIPQGTHEIVMEFKPSSYRIGSVISLICSGLILMLLVGGLSFSRGRVVER